MRRHAFDSIVLLVALVLAGCAGSFVRPDPGTLKLGETTYSDIIRRFGESKDTITDPVNGKTLKRIRYSYFTSFATASDEPNEPGVFPVRRMTYYFLDDTLVGHTFISSFKSDNSNFRDENVGKIEKGKSSRADVRRLIGEPAGFYIMPMVKLSSGAAYFYQYATLKDRPVRYGPPTPALDKWLIVSFDEGGLVSDVVFSKSGGN